MSKKIPLRQCVGCGEMKNKKEMLRVLKTEDEGIVLDTTGKKNGRGAYVCRNAECLQKAKKTKGLDRSFKMTIPEEVYDSLMKAGKVVSGEFAVDKSIKDGSAWLVIIASDASDNTTKKFSNSCEFYEVQQYIYGTKEELGRAIGRDMRSSLAITDEGFAKSLGKYLEPVCNENGDRNGKNESL